MRAATRGTTKHGPSLLSCKILPTRFFHQFGEPTDADIECGRCAAAGAAGRCGRSSPPACGFCRDAPRASAAYCDVRTVARPPVPRSVFVAGAGPRPDRHPGHRGQVESRIQSRDSPHRRKTAIAAVAEACFEPRVFATALSDGAAKEGEWTSRKTSGHRSLFRAMELGEYAPTAYISSALEIAAGSRLIEAPARTPPRRVQDQVPLVSLTAVCRPARRFSAHPSPFAVDSHSRSLDQILDHHIHSNETDVREYTHAD